MNAGESSGNDLYWIKTPVAGFRVYCDMENGGWTRILYLVDNGAKTNNLLDKGIQFTKFKAVKASDHSIFQQANFASTQTATTGLSVIAIEANTFIMLISPGGYGVWTWAGSYRIPCNWGSAVMFGSGYGDGNGGYSCGTESALRVGRDTGGHDYLNERFDVELFVQ